MTEEINSIRFSHTHVLRWSDTQVFIENQEGLQEEVEIFHQDVDNLIKALEKMQQLRKPPDWTGLERFEAVVERYRFGKF